MATTWPPEESAIEAPEVEETQENLDSDERLLPFSFAKRHGVLVYEFADHKALTIVRNDASPLSLSEARRFLQRPLVPQIVTP